MMANGELKIRAQITDLASKVGRKGNRFCDFTVRMPTNGEIIQKLVGLQSKTLEITLAQVQGELFTEDE